jgi:hypothetical protein
MTLLAAPTTQEHRPSGSECRHRRGAVGQPVSGEGPPQPRCTVDALGRGVDLELLEPFTADLELDSEHLAVRVGPPTMPAVGPSTARCSSAAVHLAPRTRMMSAAIAARAGRANTRYVHVEAPAAHEIPAARYRTTADPLSAATVHDHPRSVDGPSGSVATRSGVPGHTR